MALLLTSKWRAGPQDDTIAAELHSQMTLLHYSDTTSKPLKILYAEHNIDPFNQQGYLLGLTIAPRILFLDHACFHRPACGHGASGGPCNDEQPEAQSYYPRMSHLGFYKIMA